MNIFERAKNFFLEEAVANMPRPSATLTHVDLKGFGFDGITFLAKVSVLNPYPVPIPIGDIVYTFKSLGKVIASGSIPDPGSLAANASTMLFVTVKVPHDAVVTLVRDISGDWDIDYVLDLGMIFDIPYIGEFTIPMSYEGELKLPTIADMWKEKCEPLSCSLDCFSCVSLIWLMIKNLIHVKPKDA